jgi:hypothetical protein
MQANCVLLPKLSQRERLQARPSVTAAARGLRAVAPDTGEFLKVLQALLAPYARWFGRPRILLSSTPARSGAGALVTYEVLLGLDGRLSVRAWSSSSSGPDVGEGGVQRELVTMAEAASPEAAGELVGEDWNIDVLVDVFLALPAPRIGVLLGMESVRS